MADTAVNVEKPEHEVAMAIAAEVAGHFNTGNLEAMKPLLHDDLKFTFHGDPDLGGFVGVFDKTTLFTGMFKHLAEVFGEIKFDNVDQIAMGNRVVQFIHWNASAHREKPLQFTSILNMTIKDGQILEGDEYTDLHAFRKALDHAGSKLSA